MASQQAQIIDGLNETITSGIESAKNYLDLLTRIELQPAKKEVSEPWDEHDIKSAKAIEVAQKLLLQLCVLELRKRYAINDPDIDGMSELDRRIAAMLEKDNKKVNLCSNEKANVKERQILRYATAEDKPDHPETAAKLLKLMDLENKGLFNFAQKSEFSIKTLSNPSKIWCLESSFKEDIKKSKKSKS